MSDLSRLIYDDLNGQGCWSVEWHSPKILKVVGYDTKSHHWHPFPNWTTEDHAADVRAYICDVFGFEPAVLAGQDVIWIRLRDLTPEERSQSMRHYAHEAAQRA